MKVMKILAQAFLMILVVGGWSPGLIDQISSMIDLIDHVSDVVMVIRIVVRLLMNALYRVRFWSCQENNSKNQQDEDL